MHIAYVKKKLNLAFNNKQILKQAFTHSSYVNEHRNKRLNDNERLEFLGDAVLDLIVSEYIYETFPKMPEGEMTQLRAAVVREESLAHIANELQLGQYIILGKGEELTGGRKRPSILADVFEAFLGAIYLDLGYEQTYSFLNEHLLPYIHSGVHSHMMDYKSKLQELIQQFKDIPVTYEIVKIKGPAHNREFIAEVTVENFLCKHGKGQTKKEAEQQAAKIALDALQIQNNRLTLQKEE